MPLLLVAKPADPDADEEYVLLDGDENERVSTIIQQELSQSFSIQVE
jgi:hypothetical protein